MALFTDVRENGIRSDSFPQWHLACVKTVNKKLVWRHIYLWVLLSKDMSYLDRRTPFPHSFLVSSLVASENVPEVPLSDVYIPGPRNKIADGLSRVLLHDRECRSDGIIAAVHQAMSRENQQWIWKDGKGEVEEFLKGLTEEERSEVE